MFTILQPIVAHQLNLECAVGKYLYTPVCVLRAANLNSAFFRAQNNHSKEFTACGVRSTSVGDIFLHNETNECYMLLGMGFKKVPMPELLTV